MHWQAWKFLGASKEKGGLGFRDLNSFNVALLGKQCWRILMNPQALWVKILKAHYFPNVDFMQAGIGHRPSWIWASLLDGQDLLKQHMAMQVMDGGSINIWEDNWIRHSQGGYTPLPGLPPPFGLVMVNQLLDLPHRT
ncbi:unnamed protein product [Prunus brigantina]